MSRNSRVLWSEGLFLEPQHFQQQDRFYQSLVGRRFEAQGPYGWGFSELALDEDLLAVGKLGLVSARGVLPDGTPIAMPAEDPLPAPLEVDATVRDRVVHLALPLRADGALEVARGGRGNGLYRYRPEDMEVRDSVLDSGNATLVEVGRLNSRLALEDEPLEQYATLPVARISERRDDGQLVLDSEFLPALLRCGASRRLAGLLNELQGMVSQRIDALAGRVTASGGGAGEISDFLMLQVLNRHQPVLGQLAATPHLHPESLYLLLMGLAGELATFTTTERRAPELPAYSHEDPASSFGPLVDTLRQEFRAVRESPAIHIPLEDTGRHGIRVATVNDTSLFQSANFVLSVGASLPAEELRSRFPAQAKVAPVERIAELVNNNLPGVELVPVPVAPRQIPYYAGHAYFELSRSGSLWSQLASSAGIAVFVAGQFPDLKMDLWAIRGQRR